MKKVLFIAIFALAFTLMSSGAFAAPKIVLDGQDMAIEGIVENGRTLVPMRAIFEALGANVDWVAETKTVVANKNGLTLTLSAGNPTATVNGVSQVLDVPPKIVNGSTLVPLRFVGEALGLTVNWENNVITLNSSNTGNPEQELDIPTSETPAKQVLLDQNGVKITFSGFETDNILGEGIKFLVENSTSKNLTVNVEGVSINGYMIGTMGLIEVTAGNKTNDSIYFLTEDMEDCGINTIADCEFYFDIVESSNWRSYLKSPIIQVKTPAANSYAYTYDDSGTQLYAKDGIRIVSKGLAQDSFFGAELKLFIENTTGESMTVRADDISVNGYTIQMASLLQEVSSGKKAIGKLVIFSSDLEQNNITKISNMEFVFSISPTDSWSKSTKSEIINLNFIN